MKPNPSAPSRKRLWRLPLLAMGMASLLSGLWGGLVRLPLNLPLPSDSANWITFHGPLMVAGFLGTVIGLERAVGLPGKWTYAAPVLTGAGAMALAGGVLGWPGLILLTLGSACFVAVTFRVVQLQKAMFTITMCLGALLWFVGNLLWLWEWPVNRVVLWWIAFLALTIVGERLDLSRFQKLERSATPTLIGALGLFLSGVALSAIWQIPGECLAGGGLLALALWLGRFDIARRTIRQPGLPRFMAVCLLGGYFWLGLTGVLLLLSAPLESGLRYDAALHSFFIGFVFSMIFGHAPVIFPSVLMLPVSFHGRFYVHVAALHASLLFRVSSDLAAWPVGRQWGGGLNAVAIALFLANTVTALATGTKRSQPGGSHRMAAKDAG
ncbi:MAG: hypothetical protein HY735_23715 [Verrucomicrobia bacterium]|nr:hypothetical protein [Verrucomicrobiota bacterium]